ncbi:ribosome biogenesis protein NOP53-like [Panonychus citri]|uniref:ribosome biogenesis protein NOP53-like n=1 Tax=Panonychus citri TaxID=50023 RepID=UPI0023075A98|nr:ribosome biogenesis protein NOP53-like [Panonychus citri]
MVASKKTKFGKNRRKGWRKVNIEEVDQYLDDVRRKERIGQPLDKPDFTIDKKASEHVIPSKLSKLKKTKKLLTTKDLSKNILAYKSLMHESAVPPMVVFPKTEPKAVKIKPKEYGKRKKKKPENWRDNRVYDLWKSDSKPSHPAKTSRLKRPSILPAIDEPHPGMSINPTLEDHQELMKKAVDVELAKIKKEKTLDRILGKKPKKTETEMMKIWLEEMSGGIPGAKFAPQESDEEQVQNDPEEEGGIGPIKKIVRAEDRKPKAKRRREMLAKQRELESKKKKEEKRRASQIFQLKRIKKDIAADEEKAKKQQENLKKKFAAVVTRPARLGPHKYEEPDIPVNLPEELAARLRSVQTEGDLFTDRIKSLQKRNLIEPRKLIMKVKGKNFKWSEKRDCREPDKFAHVGKK